MKVAETRTLRVGVRVFAAPFTLEIAQREESVIPDPVQLCGEARVVELPAFCVLHKVSISMLIRRG